MVAQELNRLIRAFMGDPNLLVRTGIRALAVAEVGAAASGADAMECGRVPETCTFSIFACLSISPESSSTYRSRIREKPVQQQHRDHLCPPNEGLI
jgi:hypothetical protein